MSNFEDWVGAVAQYYTTKFFTIPQLENLYIKLFGEATIKEMKLMSQVHYLQRKIQIVTGYKNEGMDYDLDQLEYFLSQEQANYLEELAHMQAEYEAAKDFVPLSNEDLERLKEAFLPLIRDAYPGIYPDRTPLWEKSLKAFESKDLEALEALCLKGKDLDRIFLCGYQVVQIREKAEKKLASLYSEFPMNLEDQLKDQAWIETENQRLANEYAHWENQLRSLEVRASLLKET